MTVSYDDIGWFSLIYKPISNHDSSGQRMKIVAGKRSGDGDTVIYLKKGIYQCELCSPIVFSSQAETPTTCWVSVYINPPSTSDSERVFGDKAIADNRFFTIVAPADNTSLIVYTTLNNDVNKDMFLGLNLLRLPFSGEVV